MPSYHRSRLLYLFTFTSDIFYKTVFCFGIFVVGAYLTKICSHYLQIQEVAMAKSKQNNHEYYANYETCRNRLFDDFNPDWLQIEDAHLSWEEAFEDDDD